MLTNIIQFLFIADTPARQAEFDALKMQNGGKTRYLFQSVFWAKISIELTNINISLQWI